MKIATFPSAGELFARGTPFLSLPVEAPAEVPAPEYLCVWESPAMPGFVQLSRRSEPPEGAEWSLGTLSGQTRFRVTYYVAAEDLVEVEERVREVLAGDEIKQQAGFYCTPRRFAIQAIESVTGAAGKPVNLGHRRARKLGVWALAAALLVPILGVSLLLQPARPAPAKQPAFPAFRVTMNLPH